MAKRFIPTARQPLPPATEETKDQTAPEPKPDKPIRNAREPRTKAEKVTILSGQSAVAAKAAKVDQLASLLIAREQQSPLGRDVADWREAYLAALELSARKNASAKLAGVNLRTVQRRRESDTDFALAEGRAMKVAADMIEDEIFRRAIEGVEEPVYHAGKVVGTIQKYSDGLILRAAERTETGSWRQKLTVENVQSGTFLTRADRKKRLEAARAEIRRATAADTGRPLSLPSENGGSEGTVTEKNWQN